MEVIGMGETSSQGKKALSLSPASLCHVLPSPPEILLAASFGRVEECNQSKPVLGTP